jgi:bacillolysin
MSTSLPAARPPSVRRFLRCLAAGVLAAWPAPRAHAAASGGARDVEAAIQAMSASAGAPVTVTRSAATGTVSFLTAPSGATIPISDLTAITPEARARAFVNQFAKAFGLDADSNLRVTKVAAADTVGMDHVRLQQFYRGLPVTGAEMTVHLRGAGVVSALTKTVPDLSGVDVTPVLDAATAGQAAEEAVRMTPARGLVGAQNIRLEILNRGLLEGGLGVTRLAWFTEVVGEGVREYVWIDARRGIVLLRFSQLAEIKTRQVFSANSGSVLPGQPIRSEGQAAAGDADADAAYDYSGDTYDYYLAQHGRDSFDGAGAPIISSVHFCPTAAQCPYVNAAWTGTQMVYGNGFSRADDVDAHELTHALTERTANLFYYMQSGALNESISDMFGETVDLTNGKGNDDASVRWLLGEDVPGLGAIRNMMTPSLFGDPDRVYGQGFYCGRQDGGGVHRNSGVPNHAFALIVDGGAFNGKTVTGIGLAKAGLVVYRTLTTYLTSASGLSEFYDAMKQSCADLVDSSAGITSLDCGQVQLAMDAVEMPNWNCGRAIPNPRTCGAEVPVFIDDLENLSSGNWITAGGDWTGGAGVPDVYFTGYSTSGRWSLWGYAPPQVSNSGIVNTQSFLIPPMARLRFKHSYDFEPTYDGGVVEYSADEGVSWHDVTTFDDGGPRPYQVLQYRFGNPLEGHQAFTGSSYGYTTSQIFLDSFEGQRLRFRFRIGTDRAGGDVGWFIDDIQLYGCQTPPTVTVDSVTVQEGDTGTVPAVFTVTISKPFPIPLTYAYEAVTKYWAAPAEDFVPTAGKLVFAPGVTSHTISVPVIGDREYEPPISQTEETFILKVQGVPDLPGFGEGTIVDDDLPYAGLSVSDVTLPEPRTGTVNATFTVTANPRDSMEHTVAFHTADGTAFAPVDYTATSGTVTFPATDPGSGVPPVTKLTVTVPVKASATTASPRSFYLDLTNSSDLPIARVRGTATIYEPGLYPVAPCRVLDTRERDQGPALSAGSTRTVVVGEKCGLPPTATAVSLNVTVVSPTGPGDLRMFSAGSPPLVSTINYSPGQIRANNAIVPLTDRGWLSILCDQLGGVVDVVIDVNGYFE